MQPMDAIILRNKDEIHIPLLLNEIPTATEFKDAIGSLSPEQQRFAKSFRSMQLDSSVLGVCVIQIKPQLEKLLGLPEDSLTKEMKLTEDLTELFVEYQVPSDLVSCDFDNEGSKPSVKDQVENVREHVKSVLDVIANQKKEQLIEQELKTHMAFGERFEDFCEEEVEEEVGKGNYQNAGPQICLQKQQLRVPRKVNFGSRSIRASSAALPLPPPQAAARKTKNEKDRYSWHNNHGECARVTPTYADAATAGSKHTNPQRQVYLVAGFEAKEKRTFFRYNQEQLRGCQCQITSFGI